MFLKTPIRGIKFSHNPGTMALHNLASSLNMCQSIHVLELVTEAGLMHRPQPIIDEILNQVTKIDNIEALSALGLKPSMVDGYHPAILWGHTFDEAEALEIGERLLNGPDFVGSSQIMLRTSLEAVGYDPGELHISSVYSGGSRKNISTTIYKLEMARKVKVTAGIALLRSMYVPCIKFWHAFTDNAAYLVWDKCITSQHVVACLAAVMNRSHCDLVKRTMVGVRAIVAHLHLDLEAVVREAYVRCRTEPSAWSSAGAMLLYVPEARVSWFPGIKSPVVDMFRGDPRGYEECGAMLSLVRPSDDLKTVALEAGAMPPPTWRCSPFIEWTRPIYLRRDVVMPRYLFEAMQMLMWCLRDLPQELRLMVADAFYIGRKL